MAKITIIGSGMAGLLAGNMLKKHEPKIIESAPSLPNNHSAVLRFRSSVVSDVLSIPFERVKVAKGHIPWKNPVADSMSYSRKTNGTYRSDRSIVTTSNELVDRYIAPPDLISQMSQGLNIEFKKKFKAPKAKDGAYISTMPMPALMDLLDYKEKPEFKTVHGFNVSASLSETYAHFSLYVPHPEIAFNRISITGNQLIIEYSYPLLSAKELKAMYEDLVDNRPTLMGNIGLALEMCGIERKHLYSGVFNPTVKMQQYSKILPLHEDERRAFIAWATEHYNIYSLGRFAVWKPGLLLDDLVKDIRIIESFINKPHKYGLRRHWA